MGAASPEPGAALWACFRTREMYVRNVTAPWVFRFGALLDLGIPIKSDTALEALEPMQDCPVAPLSLNLNPTDGPAVSSRTRLASDLRADAACQRRHKRARRAADTTAQLPGWSRPIAPEKAVMV